MLCLVNLIQDWRLQIEKSEISNLKSEMGLIDVSDWKDAYHNAKGSQGRL